VRTTQGTRRLALAVLLVAVLSIVAGLSYSAGRIAGDRNEAAAAAAEAAAAASAAAQASTAHNEAELAAAAAARAEAAARAGTPGLCWTAAGGRVTGLAPPVAQPGGYSCPPGPWRYTPADPQPGPPPTDAPGG
jgi:hypothetical protein